MNLQCLLRIAHPRTGNGLLRWCAILSCLWSFGASHAQTPPKVAVRQALTLLRSANGIAIEDDAVASVTCERISFFTETAVPLAGAPLRHALPKPGAPRAQALDGCLRRALQIEDEFSRRRVELDIATLLMDADLEQVLEILPALDSAVQADLRAQLVDFLVRQKKLKEARDQILLMSRDDNFSFSAATHLIAATPKSDSLSRRYIYDIAIEAFRNSIGTPHFRISNNNEDFAGMIVRFWKEEPVEDVIESIDQLLRAATEEARAHPPLRVTVGSVGARRSEAIFNSVYEFRLFEVLPILRQIDPSSYKDYLQAQQSVSSQLDKFPDGLVSLNPSYAQDHGDSGTSNYISFGGALAAPADVMNGLTNETDPAKALQQALSLLARSALGGSPRVSALQALSATGDSEIAVAALRAMQDNMQNIDDGIEKLKYELEIAESYLRLHRNSDAERFLLGPLAELHSSLYKIDTNNSDPKRSDKLFWPSTTAARVIGYLESKIDPGKAINFANGLADPDIMPVLYVDIAQSLLRKPNLCMLTQSDFAEMRPYTKGATDIILRE